jgi:multisubunit Na+/H+ antiporter MnhB subunit
MKNKRKIIKGSIIIIAYLILVNLSVYAIGFSFDNYINNTYYDDGNIRIGMSDSVNIQVVKNRIYGTIKISGENTYLYILRIIPVPLEIMGFNYLLVHLIFVLFLIFILSGEEKEKQKVYKGDKPYYEYEELVN